MFLTMAAFVHPHVASMCPKAGHDNPEWPNGCPNRSPEQPNKAQDGPSWPHYEPPSLLHLLPEASKTVVFTRLVTDFRNIDSCLPPHGESICPDAGHNNPKRPNGCPNRPRPHTCPSMSTMSLPSPPHVRSEAPKIMFPMVVYL